MFTSGIRKGSCQIKTLLVLGAVASTLVGKHVLSLGGVRCYENEQPYPLYISKDKNDNEINLLLVTCNKDKHYVLSTDFIRYMYNQIEHNEP